MTAYHLLQQKEKAFAITLVEPKTEIALGLAYSTTCDEHLLNVSAAGMSALADEPEHFLNYARSKDASVLAEDFLPRKFFGQYVQELVHGAIAKIDHFHSFTAIHESAIDIAALDSNLVAETRYAVTLSNGAVLPADIVVLALGNLAGKRPAWLCDLSMESEHYLHDPWNTKAVSSIASTDSVLIVGTGLTAVDKIIELTSKGHSGKLYAVSRHGLLPRPHLDKPNLHPTQTHLNEVTESTLATFKLLRHKSKEMGWRNAVDSFRAITQTWWLGLELVEKRHFMRHLQTYWDVHRHRMAPTISQRIEAFRASDQLRVLSGGIKEMREEKSDGKSFVRAVLRQHHGEQESITINKVINCTGPQSKLSAIDSPLMANLHKSKMVLADQTGAGISCEPSGLVKNGNNQPSKIFAIGPMLKAVLLESVAVPELKVQSKNLAQLICSISSN
ncbi:FAD/NAD(P)-binding protein [soil metagenome]